MKNKGFTLIELLVVMAILGVLISIVAGGFRSSQARGRDAQRKSDLKQVANALELYISDYGKYPDSVSGQIVGCAGNPCAWGTGTFTDNKTVYFKKLPQDPTSTLVYNYNIVDPPTNQKFQLFAHLENSQDQDIDSEIVTDARDCGSAICNFGISSTNTTPTE